MEALVLSMAIPTVRRIRVSSQRTFTTNTFGVTFIRVAGLTSLDHPLFIALPGSQLMNIYVAVNTLNFIQ
jgi:hypothetical protein